MLLRGKLPRKYGSESEELLKIETQSSVTGTLDWNWNYLNQLRALARFAVA